MRGYKVFNPDWTCRGFQFEVGKTFTEDVTPVCCDRGFHFCTKAADCFKYYDFDPDNKVAEVEALVTLTPKMMTASAARIKFILSGKSPGRKFLTW